MNKADIENFQSYLDKYLKVLRKFHNYEKITDEQNEAAVNNGGLFQNEVKKLNITVSKNHSSEVYSKSNINFTNSTEFRKNSSVHKGDAKSTVKTTFVNKTSNEKTNNTKIEQAFLSVKKNLKTEENRSKNLTESINNFFLSGSHKQSERPFKGKIDNNTLTPPNLNHTLKKNETSPIVIKSNRHTIQKRKQMNISLSTSSKKNQAVKPALKQHKKIAGKDKNKTFREYDQIYSDLKVNKLNAEFEKKEMESESKEGKKILNSDQTEAEVYRRLFNIGLSIIVIGLLMGIFLGLILVMYLNSKN